MLNKLLEERAGLVARVDEIDAELAKSGIRMEVKPKRSRPAHAAILAAVTSGPKSGREIAELTGQGPHATQQMLHLMVKAGELQRVRRGEYAAPTAKRTKTVKR